ncbi:MAG: hypothetical protein WAV31_03740 [Candidatus Moraniibacteriota bacterium]
MALRAKKGFLVPRKRAIAHIARALNAGKFFSKELPMTGEADAGFYNACENFLVACKGKRVKRVVNAFRSTKSVFFDNITSLNYVTKEVVMATEGFLSALDVDSEQMEEYCQPKLAVSA